MAVLDILGQLNQLYALSTIALVGGSFLPELTGHNPLEPAAVSRPIIFGPYMSSFQLEADDLLKAGAAVESRPEHLSRHLKTWLTQPSAAKESGLKARSILAARPPAAPALARIILKLAGHA